MALRTSLPRKVHLLVTVVASFLLVLLGFVAAPASATADPLYCGSSTYIDQIEVARYADGSFTIKVHPNSHAREYSAWVPDQRSAVIDEWHAVQACVPGLYGDLADSIWQQLECHQILAFAINPATRTWSTGPTYDLESWRPKLDSPNLYSEVKTRCLNALGIGPAGAAGDPIRPDAGQTDLDYGDYA